eukprot:5498188-Pyramimonas_sp.AAC.1
MGRRPTRRTCNIAKSSALGAVCWYPGRGPKAWPRTLSPCSTAKPHSARADSGQKARVLPDPSVKTSPVTSRGPGPRSTNPQDSQSTGGLETGSQDVGNRAL